MVIYKASGKGKLLKIKAILFDFGGTLCTQAMDEPKKQTAIIKEMENISTKMGYPLPDRFYRNLDDKSWQAWKDEIGHPQKEYPVIDFLIYLLGKTSIPEEWHKKLASEVEKIVYNYNLRSTSLKPTVKTTLEKLRMKNYQLGVVSNTPFSYEHIVDILKNLEVFDCFNFVLTSSLVGFVKPNEVIFKEALKKLNLRADETVFVGNDPKEDVGGAKAVGMSTVQIIDDGSIPSPAADFTVSKLINVLFLLDNCRM